MVLWIPENYPEIFQNLEFFVKIFYEELHGEQFFLI